MTTSLPTSGDTISLLPSSVRPLHYDLTLIPELETATFAGTVRVELEILSPVEEIVLNAIEVRVQGGQLRIDGEDEPRTFDDIVVDEEAETLTLTFDGGTLPVGEAYLNLSFTGILNDQLHGFYLSTYQAQDGTTRRMATTQFEATDARRCFPCWDEPAAKATFKVTLVVPTQLQAVSNTLVESRASYPALRDRDRIVFQPTPRMSTYLLVFIVGDLESIETTGDNGTLVRVWTMAGHGEQGRYALETSVRLLTYYNSYFGVPYPLEKLDHIAIPDFAAGAMENWGAITYREVALLFDPSSSSPGTRQRIVEIIAHEMAHMWFGDLVTMRWWNDLWLNESFASWMATKATDVLEPTWQEWTQFITMDTISGLNLDGLESSHPIFQEVNNPAEVSQLFDAISYSKGASILRMLEEYLGEDAFREGLRLYMQRHAYGNAAGADLWGALQDASKQDIPAMMRSWVEQVGFPVVSVDVRRDGGDVSVSVTQRRFLYSGPNEDPMLWHVPLRIMQGGRTDVDTFLLKDRSSAVPLPRGVSDGWLHFNGGGSGFYRVRYAPDELARLIRGLLAGELSAPDRLGLLDDTYALARARLVEAVQFLDLARAYRGDEDYSVWATLAGHLGGIESLIANEPFAPAFRTFGRSLIGQVVASVGWDPDGGEPHVRTLLRSVVLSLAGSFGDPTVLAEAKVRFERYLADSTSLRPDLRAVVYSLAAEGGDAATFQTIRRLAHEATFQEEMVRFQLALARFPDPAIIAQALDLVLSDEIRVQDAPRLLMAVAANPRGRLAAWEYMKNNWPEFDRRYGGGGFAVMRLVAIPGGFTTEEARRDVESFFRSNPVPSATRTVEQSLERIDLNRRWLDANRDGVEKWLAREAT